MAVLCDFARNGLEFSNEFESETDVRGCINGFNTLITETAFVKAGGLLIAVNIGDIERSKSSSRRE